MPVRDTRLWEVVEGCLVMAFPCRCALSNVYPRGDAAYGSWEWELSIVSMPWDLRILSAQMEDESD